MKLVTKTIVNTPATAATSGTNMTEDVNVAWPPTTVPSPAHRTRQQIAPSKNCDIPDLLRYPNANETKSPVTHPAGTLEAIAAVAANALKAIKPDANGEASFRRHIEQFPFARTSSLRPTSPTNLVKISFRYPEVGRSISIANYRSNPSARISKLAFRISCLHL